jgi:hypothetical protein
MRRRVGHYFALAVYLAAVVVCPALHLVEHARGLGAHVHGAARVAESGAAPADLVLLGLEDVAAAPTIDCGLAALTLVDCASPAHGTRRFGDAAPARDGAQAPPDLDPAHGAGSFEHLGVSILAARAFVLPPPSAATRRIALAGEPVRVSLHLRLTHHPRGPPAAV